MPLLSAQWIVTPATPRAARSSASCCASVMAHVRSSDHPSRGRPTPPRPSCRQRPARPPKLACADDCGEASRRATTCACPAPQRRQATSTAVPAVPAGSPCGSGGGAVGCGGNGYCSRCLPTGQPPLGDTAPRSAPDVPTPPVRTRWVLVASAAAVALAAAAIWVGLATTDTSASVRLEAVSQPRRCALHGTHRQGPRRRDAARGPRRRSPRRQPRALRVRRGRLRPRGVGGGPASQRQGRGDGRGPRAAPTATPPLRSRRSPRSCCAPTCCPTSTNGRARPTRPTPPCCRRARSCSSTTAASPACAAAAATRSIRPDNALGDDLAGKPWRWFTPSAVATVNPADHPLPAFAAIDLESGAAVQIPARH